MQAVARVRLLMSVSVEKQPLSATMAVGAQCSEITDLKEDVKRLSEQMAALVNKCTPADQTAAAVASPSVSVIDATTVTAWGTCLVTAGSVGNNMCAINTIDLGMLYVTAKRIREMDWE